LKKLPYFRKAVSECLLEEQGAILRWGIGSEELASSEVHMLHQLGWFPFQNEFCTANRSPILNPKIYLRSNSRSPIGFLCKEAKGYL